MSRRFVSVELGGKERQLRFDFNAVADLEDHFGKGIASVMSEEQVGFRTIRALYWAGLKWRNHRLTVEKVGEWLQDELEAGSSFESLLNPIIEAMKAGGLLGTTEEEVSKEDEEKN